MATPTTTISLAKICEYLYTTNGLKQSVFFNGQVDDRRNLQLYMERKAIEYGNEQNLQGLQGATNYVYTLLGTELQRANEVLNSGSSGGIIVNPSTGVVDITYYEAVFIVGDVDAPILDGESSYTVNIGLNKSFDAKSVIVTRDQVNLPRGVISGYTTFDAAYSLATGLVTISFSDAVLTNQLYTIQFPYITL